MKITNTILDQILENKEKEVAHAKNTISLEDLKKNVSKRQTEVRDFYNALKKKNAMSLIAEIKKSSPSKGVIKSEFNHIAIAETYEKSGCVDAISVLTDEKYFQGNLSFLKDVKQVTSVPILRKDFIIDEYQVYESYNAEADAILLIVAALEQKQLQKLLVLANALGLACLVEIHTQDELQIALQVNAKIIGVNARDLKTFTIHKELFRQLLSHVPDIMVKVAESGIENRTDVQEAQNAGAQAILVGSSIMQTTQIREKLQELKGTTYGSR